MEELIREAEVSFAALLDCFWDRAAEHNIPQKNARELLVFGLIDAAVQQAGKGNAGLLAVQSRLGELIRRCAEVN